jgi:hypothetical protein
MNALAILLLSVLALPAQSVAAPRALPVSVSLHIPTTALLGLPAHGRTCEKCSGQLVVVDAIGNRISILRGQATWVRVGPCGVLHWFCGATPEVTRGIASAWVLVWHDPGGRNIVLRW